MLSDGRQVRKTGNEKELVLVRVEKFGISVYFVVSLLDMATFGGTNALKKVWAVFETGNIPIDNYQTKLVSATADGANVTLGIYGGALTKMENTGLDLSQ